MIKLEMTKEYSTETKHKKKKKGLERVLALLIVFLQASLTSELVSVNSVTNLELTVQFVFIGGFLPLLLTLYFLFPGLISILLSYSLAAPCRDSSLLLPYPAIIRAFFYSAGLATH